MAVMSRVRPDGPVDNLVSHVKEVAGVVTVGYEQIVQGHANYRSDKVSIMDIIRDKIKDLHSPATGTMARL